jgi:hypothetical protein
VSHYHQAVGQVELVRVAPAIGVDLVPVSRLELIKGVPKRDLVVSVHIAPLVADWTDPPELLGMV